jgi:hypothetical protein
LRTIVTCLLKSSSSTRGFADSFFGSGGTPVEGWTAVNYAMVPFLMLAGGALVWLALRSRPQPASRPACTIL